MPLPAGKSPMQASTPCSQPAEVPLFVGPWSQGQQRHSIFLRLAVESAPREIDGEAARGRQGAESLPQC